MLPPRCLWYANNPDDIPAFEKQMRRKVHYVVQPLHLWNSIANMARTQRGELLNTLQTGFKYIETESFESTFQGLFSEINLGSDKLGKTYADRNAKLCTIIQKIAEGLTEFSTDIDALGEDVRFKNHGLAPKSAADFAFLLHGFHFLKDEGVMAIILPHGVLVQDEKKQIVEYFRGLGNEKDHWILRQLLGGALGGAPIRFCLMCNHKANKSA